MPVLAKKLLTWLVIAFLIFFMAFRPDSAASMTRTIGGALMAIAQGFGDFFSRVLA